jgi:alpha-glucosidase (family GH31 glycosyl hydrolase)
MASGTSLLGAPIHLATDGERAIVLTEWIDAAAHDETISDGPALCRR